MIDPADIKTEPLDIKEELDPDSTTGNRPKKKPGRPKQKQPKITEHGQVVKKKKHDRFKGMPEEEVLARFLPDRLTPDLDIVIVGINPGLYAAYIGHHYAGPGNHFWKCMFLSGLIPEPMNALQDEELLKFGIGFTNIVARTSRGSADLTRKEIKEGAKILTEKLLKYRPKIAVFNGKGIYEVFVGHKNFYFGKQPEPLPGTNTAVYVMPSSSARCSQLPRAVDKVPFYAALKKFRDHLIGNLPDLNESEITFPDLELKTAKKEPKQEIKEEPNEEHSTMGGDPALEQFMPGAYNVIPHTFPSTGQDTQYHNTISSQNLPHIKQELGTSPPLPQLQPMVSVKQEPGLEPPTSYPCQSNASFQSQGYSYSQMAPMSLPSTNGTTNNSLTGIFGLVDKFASQGSYGVVQQTGSAGDRPIQFNDALCDILSERSSLELVPEMCAQQPAEAAKDKKPKSRKRKTASSGETPSPPHAAENFPVSSMNQSVNGNISQTMSQTAVSHPICQPLPVYAPPPFTQGYPMYSQSAMMGLPPFSMPQTTMQGQQYTTDGIMSQAPNYTQMMNVGYDYQSFPNSSNNYMQQNSNMHGYLQGQFQGQPQGLYVDSQGQGQGPLPPQAVTVKQEKPDE